MRRFVACAVGAVLLVLSSSSVANVVAPKYAMALPVGPVARVGSKQEIPEPRDRSVVFHQGAICRIATMGSFFGCIGFDEQAVSFALWQGAEQVFPPGEQAYLLDYFEVYLLEEGELVRRAILVRRRA